MKFALLLAIFVVVIDQVVKALVVKFGYPYVINSGGVFGLFPGTVWIQPLVVVACSIVFGYWVVRSKRASRQELVVIGLFAGGGFANLLDRLRFGGVVDFIDIGIFTSFNLADLAIVGGLVIFLCQRTFQVILNNLNKNKI